MANYCNSNPNDINCSCLTSNNTSLDPVERIFTNNSKCWKQSCIDSGYQSLAQKRTKCAAKSVICSNVANITGSNAGEIHQYCGTKPPEEIVVVDYNLILFIIILCVIIMTATLLVWNSYRQHNKD